MCSGIEQIQNQLSIVYSVNEQPIRLYMAFTTTCIFAT